MPHAADWGPWHRQVTGGLCHQHETCDCCAKTRRQALPQQLAHADSVTASGLSPLCAPEACRDRSASCHVVTWCGVCCCQVMKFAARVAPRAVVTTGRGTTGEHACHSHTAHRQGSPLQDVNAALVPAIPRMTCDLQLPSAHLIKRHLKAGPCKRTHVCPVGLVLCCRCWADCVCHEGGWGLEP